MKAEVRRTRNSEEDLTANRANLRESSRIFFNGFYTNVGRFPFVLLILLASISSASELETKPLFTILYTAESHAALLPCDCPLQPLGGVARRATLIKRFRERGPVLLLDGGGWGAGGAYDEDSDGDPARDALRTQLMRDAMRVMKYDSAALSEDDVEGLKAASDLPAPFEGKRIQIAGTAVDAAVWNDPGINIFGTDSPTPILICQIHPLAEDSVAVRLSRLGEEENSAFARHPNCADLVLNAGRKTSQRVGWRLNSSTLVNFDFQARNLIVVEVFTAKPASGARYEFRARLEPLGKDIPDDPEISKLLAPHLEALKKKGKKTIALEYWSMPDCPFCKLARPELEALAKDLAGRVTIAPHWVVEKDGDSLRSLHGDEELNEARVQALIWKYYPEKIWEWLAWRVEHRDPWQTGAEKFELLRARIEQALAAGEADTLLLADVELSARRRVTATPSVVIGNRLFEGKIERLQLLGALCGMLEDPKPDACKNAPACFADAQCRKRGFVVKCVDPGTPAARCDTSKPAVKVPATVLVDKDALASNQDRILEILIGDLPGLDYKLVDAGTAEGKRLAEQAKVTRLPAYLLDPIAKTEEGFKQCPTASVVREISFPDEKGGEARFLALREDMSGVGSNRILARMRVKGHADLYVSRFSKNGQEALETALEFAKLPEATGLALEIHDVVFFVEGGAGEKEQLGAKGGLAELEEAARAEAVREIAPQKFNDYLIERGKMRGSSYWDAPLKKLGIDVEKVRALAEVLSG